MNLLKVKIRKEHKNIFCGPSKIFKNISWLINICLKYFMTPVKTLHHPPSRILNVRSLNKNINWKTNLTLLLTVKKKHSNKSVNSLFTIVFYHRFFPQLYPLPHLIFKLLRRNTLMHPTRCLVQIWPLWPLETNPAMYRVNSDKVM